MYEIGKDDLVSIVYGATFLASGGGGPWAAGMSMVQEFPDDGVIRVVSVAEAAADAGARSAVGAYIGAPDAMYSLTSADAVVKAMRRLATLTDGKTDGKIVYSAPVEIGAVSSVVACLVAHALDGAVIDGDGAGRAVPTLTMTTFSGAGLPGNPAVLDNDEDQCVVIETPEVADVEAMARPLLDASAFGEMAGLAMWPMTGADLTRAVTITGTLALCRDLGQILRSINPVDRAFALLQKHGWTPQVLARGKVHLAAHSTEGGFDVGKVALLDDAGMTVACTYNQNENLIAWSTGRAQPLAIGPDLICYLTATGVPFSNADIEAGVNGNAIEGQEAMFVGIPARPAMTGNASIMAAFRDALVGLGYAGCYMPLHALQQ